MSDTTEILLPRDQASVKPITAATILEGLIEASADKIWASELALLGRERRIDFWTLEPAASRGFRATSYEIKVSRADFFRDTEEKQQGAISYSDRFWYVTPPGLVRKDEVPKWAGLIEWRDRVVKRAPKLVKREPDWDFVVSLMRNCGDSRRDVGLLLSQLAFYQQRDKARKAARESHGEWQRKRWEAKALRQHPDWAVNLEPQP